MTVTVFSNPAQVQDAIIVCLARAFTAEEWQGMQFHKGELGTGHAIDCCKGSVLRVETGDIVPNDTQGRRWLARTNGCVELDQQFVVTYKRCFNSLNAKGKVKTNAELQTQGQTLQELRWAAIEAMACCDDYLIRFVSSVPDRNLETCAGFTLTLDATMKVCAGACAPAAGASG